MDVEKNGGRLFRRPKFTLSCNAERKEGMPLGGSRFLRKSFTYQIAWYVIIS
jgi:hypothetical protein